MPRQENTPTQPMIEEDEIDLRELFATIGRYKWSIFFITLLITAVTAVVAYRMPKYYKTTTVIEVKPKPGDREGFSLAGAGALLGLSSGGGRGSIGKDAALLVMYKDNEAVLDSVDYSVQYYDYGRFRYTELPENNCSISITDLKIHDYKKQGMEIAFESISAKSFRLLSIGRFSNSTLGTFLYNKPAKTEDFILTLHKNRQGAIPAKIKLNTDKRYIFEKLISKNLSASVDKENPFLSITLLDTLPQRAEHYLQTLIQNHTKRSIQFELEDADITLASINKQLSEIETKVRKNATVLEQYKAKNKILSPGTQAQTLLRGEASTDDKIIQNKYKLHLVGQLIVFVKKNKNIDAIAPTLNELNDQPTISLIQKLQTLQLEASSLAQEFKPAYPKLKSIRSQIRIIKKKIYSNLLNLQKTLRSRQRSLSKLQQEYANKLTRAPTKEREMKSILVDYTLNQKLYGYLLQKRSSAEIKKAEAMSRFRTIEPIYTNPAPAKPKKALIVIVGFITALILSIFLAFFREFLRGDRER